MFREMRRSNQQLSDEETKEILRLGKTAVLAVIGDGGYPYTVPINYVYAGDKIYFHGAKSGHKFDSIMANDKASLCVIEKDDVVADELTTYYKSVIVFGRVKVTETDEDTYRAAELLGLKYLSNEAVVDREIKNTLNRLCCFEISIEHMTGKEAKELTKMRNR